MMVSLSILFKNHQLWFGQNKPISCENILLYTVFHCQPLCVNGLWVKWVVSR